MIRYRLTEDGKDKRVGEMSIERQLDHVPPQTQGAGGLNQARENVHKVKEAKIQCPL